MKIPANWTFERADIAADFDRHVREQLPWYDLATQAVAHIARHYIPRGGLVYDVGASTGNIGRALSATLADRGASLVSIEPAEEMAALYAGPQPENLVIADALDFDFAPADLIVLFLTAMFMPPSRRGMFFADLQRKLKPGGALVVGPLRGILLPCCGV